MNFVAAIKFDPTLGEARAALLAITEGLAAYTTTEGGFYYL